MSTDCIIYSFQPALPFYLYSHPSPPGKAQCRNPKAKKEAVTYLVEPSYKIPLWESRGAGGVWEHTLIVVVVLMPSSWYLLILLYLVKYIRQNQIPYVFTSLWNLKNTGMNRAKQTQTYRYREQASGHQASSILKPEIKVIWGLGPPFDPATSNKSNRY